MASNGILPTSLQGSSLISNKSRAGSSVPVSASARRNDLSEPGPDNKGEIVLNALTAGRAPSLSTSGPIAAFRVNDAIRLLNQNNKATESPALVALQKSARFGGLQRNRLEGIRGALNNLAGVVDTLLADESLNTRRGYNSRRDLVEVTVSRNATPSLNQLVPTRRAVENTLVSDKRSTALGLTGSFLVNGYEITVVATDSIFEIRDKINYGEDTNKNGQLDGPEDLNQNGQIDVINVSASEAGPGRFEIEDRNGNGTLDPSEDSNGNNRLDGGSARNNVSAVVINDRLILTGIAGSDKKISLQDSDGILLELGFFALNSKGQPVLQELKYDEENLSPRAGENLNKDPVFAEIQLNRKTLESDSNRFQSAIEGVEITVKQASDNNVVLKVLLDVEQTFQQIESFVGAFNDAVGKINETLVASQAFAVDIDVQNIRNDLTQTTQQKTRELERRNQNISALNSTVENQHQVGLSVENADKNIQSETSISSALENARRGLSFSARESDILYQRLNSLGIQTLQDDQFKIDPTELKRGLTINTDEVLDLFLNEKTGILPQLKTKLEDILSAGIGDLDFKETKVNINTTSPNILARDFQKFFENRLYENTIQNLITVA
jgi:flagellar capping protein FliD